MKKLIYFLFEAGIKTSSFLPKTIFVLGRETGGGLLSKLHHKREKQDRERWENVDNRRVVLSLPLMHPKQGICAS